MKSNKEYRFKDNPKEKKLHDKFIEMFKSTGIANKILSAIIFGWRGFDQKIPNRFLTDDEEDICLNLIQWLGSPVGQSFLEQCGFINKQTK